MLKARSKNRVLYDLWPLFIYYFLCVVSCVAYIEACFFKTFYEVHQIQIPHLFCYLSILYSTAYFLCLNVQESPENLRTDRR